MPAACEPFGLDRFVRLYRQQLWMPGRQRLTGADRDNIRQLPAGELHGQEGLVGRVVGQTPRDVGNIRMLREEYVRQRRQQIFPDGLRQRDGQCHAAGFRRDGGCGRRHGERHAYKQKNQKGVPFTEHSANPISMCQRLRTV